MKNDLIAVKGVCLANSSYLRDFFKLHKVETHLSTGLLEITDSGVVVKNNKGEIFNIDADSVILSVGYVPNPIATKKVHLVGDCNKVGNLRTVIWNAWDVAMKI